MKLQLVSLILLITPEPFCQSNYQGNIHGLSNPEYFFEEDIIIYDTDNDENGELGDAITSPIRLWVKNGTEVPIPYTVPDGLDDHQKEQIGRAVAEFNMKTCIKFIPRTSEPDFVHIDPIHYVMSCRSTVGRKGGRQIVRAGNCKVDGNFHYGPLIHELMHVAGFTHENNRDDRDAHIYVNFTAIQEYEKSMFFPNGTWQREFIKCGFTRIGRKWGCRTLTTYDHYSITHYPGTIGVDKPHTIITSKDLCGNKTCVHGQRERLSQLDIRDIELLYQCGMSYQQHEALCEATLSEVKELEAERIRNDELSIVCQYVDCSHSQSQSLCPEQCLGRNSSEAGIWYHTPDIGSDLIITHNTSNVAVSCVLHYSSRNYLLQLFHPENPFTLDRPTEDDGRIILQRTRDGSCKAVIKRIQFMDGGEWTFLIEDKRGQNKTLKKHRHNIDVRQNDTTASAICKDNIDCSAVTPDLCRVFPHIKKDCLASCGVCKCQDNKDCSAVTARICELYPRVKNDCHKTCNVCKDASDKKLGDWINNGSCIALAANRSCGPGTQHQIRQCINGTKDKCTISDIERKIDCQLPDCVKSFGEWKDQGECQVVGENKICAAGLQRQVRSCQDGKSDTCTEQETFRLFPCRQNETDLICEVIIQVHAKGKGEYFLRSWEGYKLGFGTIQDKNYWMGLEQMHNITGSDLYGLELRLKQNDDQVKVLKWSRFRVKNENEKYKLYVSGFQAGNSGLSDRFSYHNGRQFSTIDRDNDSWGNHCAGSRGHGKGSGWWYNSCYYLRLNYLDCPSYQGKCYEESTMIVKRRELF